MRGGRAHEVPALSEEILVIDRCWGRKGQSVLFRDLVHGRLAMLQEMVSHLYTLRQHSMDSWIGVGDTTYLLSEKDPRF